VEGGTRANLNYLDQLSKYHKQHGTSLNRFPSVDKRPLDLYRLKKAVEIRGGFATVCRGKKWAEIGRDLGYSGKIMSSLSTSLKNSYSRYLQPYEEWVKSAKPGVQQQIEAEFGGPITPSPVSTPMKGAQVQKNGSPNGSSFGPDSPAIKASPALAASVSTPAKLDAEMTDVPPTTAGTPCSVGGYNGRPFTPVNSGPAPGFVSVNGMKREPEAGLTPSSSSLPSGDSISSTRGSPEAKGGNMRSPPKRLHSPESGSDSRDVANGRPDDAENGERRSKRLKKGTFVVVGHRCFCEDPSLA